MKNKVLAVLVLLTLIACNEPEPRKPVVRKSSSFLKESIVRNKAINKLEENAFMELMKSDSTHTYISSESGFWYYYNTKDTITTIYPKKGDEVIFTYQIRDIHNDVLYSEEELGQQNYLVDEQELITGLQDGIKLMKEGEEVTFLFPSHKAYGYSGHDKIASNQPLIYTVSLKKIIVNNK
ncbi:MAG: gliding motility-associated peptidyl-prolyl isomerase GldI [Flavobacteriaceae bacterium]